MPAWYLTINLSDVWKSEALDFDEQVEKIVQRLKYSGWSRLSEDPERLERVIQSLASASNENEFNAHLDDLYDLADLDRVWIETH